MGSHKQIVHQLLVRHDSLYSDLNKSSGSLSHWSLADRLFARNLCHGLQILATVGCKQRLLLLLLLLLQPKKKLLCIHTCGCHRDSGTNKPEQGEFAALVQSGVQNARRPSWFRLQLAHSGRFDASHHAFKIQCSSGCHEPLEIMYLANHGSAKLGTVWSVRIHQDEERYCSFETTKVGWPAAEVPICFQAGHGRHAALARFHEAYSGRTQDARHRAQ